MGIDVERRGEIVLSTGYWGKTRGLRAPMPGLNVNGGPCLKYTDLDEVTGRIAIVVGPRRRMGGMSTRGSNWDDAPYARRLYIGDLPI